MVAKYYLIFDNGMVLFPYIHKTKFLIFTRKRIRLSPFDEPEEQPEQKVARKMYPMARIHHLIDGRCMESGRDNSDKTYYVIATIGGEPDIDLNGGGYRTKGCKYYAYDTQEYDKRTNRTVTKPVFTDAFNKAEIIKSADYAFEAVVRFRQAGVDCAVIPILLDRENELTRRNIIVVLKDKDNKKKRAQFIKDYDDEQPEGYKIPMTDKSSIAKHYTYDEYLSLYDDIHARHKNFIVLPKILTDDEPVHAKDVDGTIREGVEVTLRPL